MSNVNLAFCRRMLTEAHKLVQQHFPRTNVKLSAWTWTDGRGYWEFHGPDKFNWYGSADNAYDCRYKGWMAWLKHKGIEI